MILEKQNILKEKFSLEIIYSLSLVIILIVFAFGLIPTGFYTDDFVFMEGVQKEGFFLKNVFDTEPLASSYYRPTSTLIWGICYHIFGLWSPGYNIVELLLYLGILMFFYKSVCLLTNPTISFIASLFLLLHTATELLSWLAWLSTISALLFLWFTIYFIIRNSILSRNIYLLFICCGTVFAILSRETTYVPLMVILFYYTFFYRPVKKLHSYVYGLLIAFILSMMTIGPSGIFRATSGHRASFILTNLPLHSLNIFYSGLPILAIPFLFSIIIFVRDRNIFKSFTFYLVTSGILMGPAILKIYRYQITKIYSGKYIDAYLLAFIICILVLIWRKYLYEFFITLLNEKVLIWYFLFICTFAPILTFYLPTRAYHYDSFSFLLAALALTYFIWSNKIRTAFFHDVKDNKVKIVCIVMIVSSLMLNVFVVVYRSLNFRNTMSDGYVVTAEKKYRNAISSLLENVADYTINNSKSNSLVVSKSNNKFSDNYNFSNNSRFLFIHIRHKDKNFKIIYDPNIQVRNYSSDFIYKLELLDLDTKINYDPETEKYIMEKVGENLITNSSFEHHRDMSFKYSNQSHSGDFSMVFSKNDYPKNNFCYRFDLGYLVLEPGFYLFGGYYKSDNLSDNALYEIEDNRGYKVGRWETNTISGSKEWKLLKGKLYLKEKSKLILRPLRIDNYISGEINIDDLFLIKLEDRDFM